MSPHSVKCSPSTLCTSVPYARELCYLQNHTQGASCPVKRVQSLTEISYVCYPEECYPGVWLRLRKSSLLGLSLRTPCLWDSISMGKPMVWAWGTLWALSPWSTFTNTLSVQIFPSSHLTLLEFSHPEHCCPIWANSLSSPEKRALKKKPISYAKLTTYAYILSSLNIIFQVECLCNILRIHLSCLASLSF